MKPSTGIVAAFYELVKIILLIALITDLSTEFDFRNYHFLTLFVVLSVVAVTILVCMDLGCSVTLIDCAFLLK